MLSFPKLTFVFFISCLSCFGQKSKKNSQEHIIHNDKQCCDSIIQPIYLAQNLIFSGYIEAFYSFDFNKPNNQKRLPFLYSFNRHNQLSFNIALLKIEYKRKMFKANFGIMAGTYVNDNMGSEWTFLRYINEANLSFKLSKLKNVWLQLGVFPSHIGFESAIGAENWNLSRSLLAENSPYFESGLNIVYKSNNQKWTIGGYLLNGWQRIYRPDGNNLPATGHQVIYIPNKTMQFTSSSYIGFEKKITFMI